MTMRRMLVMAGGAVVPIALISILLGNQWVVDAIDESGLRRDKGLAPLLYWLLFPKWRLTSGDITWNFVVALDVSTVLFFVLLIVLAVVGARTVDPDRGPLGALVTGWWATVVAGGVAGFFQGVLIIWALDLAGDRGPNAFSYVSHGAAFGFAYGWLAGLGMLFGHLLSRPRGPAAQQPGQYARQPGQYAPQQPGMPMQQPYGQPMQQQPMPQQPMQQQGVPYVPPQQPWGGVPQQQYPQQQVPGQPGAAQPGVPQPGAPQQYGAAPQQPSVPQQPSAPPAEQAPPAAPEARDEPAQDPAQGPAQDAPKDAAPENDDLDLADRTIIDRKRDGEDD